MKCVVCNKDVQQIYAVYLADGEFKVHLHCFFDKDKSVSEEERAVELIRKGRTMNNN